MDINADGHRDILVGSFSGTPQIIMGTADGFAPPVAMVDAEGEDILISAFWNTEDEKWDESDRSGTEGHCTSSSFVDWDDDGDLDLLLGDYYGGRLYYRLNEGTPQEPRFATTNSPVLAAAEPIVIEKGLAAPCVVDWDGDGLFDILCGGSKGGVFLYRNTGRRGEPAFDAPRALIAPVEDKSNSFVKLVPAKDGRPTLPGSSFHIEVVDYDADGDLDLLVGARSGWMKTDLPKLTPEQEERLAEVEVEFKKALDGFMEITRKAKTAEERKALVESEEYQKAMQEYSALAKERAKLKPNPMEMGDFVWLYRRK